MIDSALFFIEDGDREKGVSMLHDLISKLVGAEDRATAILDGLRPRLISALNAVASELCSEHIADSDAAIRAARMAGALLMSKSLAVKTPTKRDERVTEQPKVTEQLLHARASHVKAVGTVSGAPEPRAHHAASRKALRALADMCLKAPSGSLGWAAA
eukprot:1297916-Prymnesium_polylepis.1